MWLLCGISKAQRPQTCSCLQHYRFLAYVWINGYWGLVLHFYVSYTKIAKSIYGIYFTLLQP